MPPSSNEPDSGNRFDDLRRKFPELGFALYAIDPTEDVVLEVHKDGGTALYVAKTAEEAMDSFDPPIDIFD